MRGKLRAKWTGSGLEFLWRGGSNAIEITHFYTLNPNTGKVVRVAACSELTESLDIMAAGFDAEVETLELENAALKQLVNELAGVNKPARRLTQWERIHLRNPADWMERVMKRRDELIERFNGLRKAEVAS